MLQSPTALDQQGPAQPRRALIRGLALGLLAPVGLLWHLVARRRARHGRTERVRLPVPTTDGVVFHGPIILYRAGAALVALSARCPHLGCLVSRRDGQALVCPCHGSRFTLDGQLRQGPAGTHLSQLPSRREPEHVTVTITGGS